MAQLSAWMPAKRAATQVPVVTTKPTTHVKPASKPSASAHVVIDLDDYDEDAGAQRVSDVVAVKPTTTPRQQHEARVRAKAIELYRTIAM